ncbi:NAD(+) diphosphatase [Amycolatopsis marina]|nr:NAD(+) diphosphatase [Amycolatopsis marina]
MSAPFEFGALPALSRSGADRQENLRGDRERLLSRWPDARVVLVGHATRTPVRAVSAGSDSGGQYTLSTRKALSFGDEPPEDALFLGEWDGTDYWALPGEPEDTGKTERVRGGWGFWEEVPAADGELWVELRGHGHKLDDASAGLLTTAVALRNWHRRARFCARCGEAAARTQFGWASWCASCEREEYPRTDPAVICLVHDDVGTNGKHVLLARQPMWPRGRYSVLAGFVEAGESLEGCVEREIREEVGAEVWGIRYLGSQPWPFPRSIMLGFAARADASAPLRPADGEIEEANWYSRAEVRAALAADEIHEPGFEAEPGALLLPGNSSIAKVMLNAWAAAEA